MKATTLTPRRLTRRSFLSGTASVLGLSAVLPSIARAQPAKPDELVVRAWGGNWKDSIETGVAKGFSEATGIRVSFDTTYHEEMKSKIWAATAQGRTPPVHVNWDISATAIESALRGVCVDLGDVPNLGNMADIAIPSGIDGVPYVNVYTYVYALAYADGAFPDGPPKSWNVLRDSKFKGRVGIYDTGDGIIQVSPLAGGGTRDDVPGNMEIGWEWLKELRANEPLLGKDPDFTKWFQTNEIDVACTILTNAVSIKNEGVNVSWTVPDEGAYVATDCLWVPTGLSDDETYWAKQFVNYAISREAQQKWCNLLGLPGTISGFEPPQSFIGDPAYPSTPAHFDKLLRISDIVKSQHWNDWQLRFKEIMNV